MRHDISSSFYTKCNYEKSGEAAYLYIMYKNRLVYIRQGRF